MSRECRELVVIGGCGELGWETVKAGSTSPHFDSVLATHYRTPPSSIQSKWPNVRWVELDCGDHTASRCLLNDVSSTAVAVIYCAVPKHGGANGTGGKDVRKGIVDDVLHVAKVCSEHGARFIAISTDLVFDGRLSTGLRYLESDQVSPTSLYGKYKAEMESALESMGNVVIARSSLILTLGDPKRNVPHGKGVRFVSDALEGKLAGQTGAFTMFTDELRCMSFSDDMAAALVELASPSCAHSGLVHLVSDEVTNRFELACRLAKYLGLPASIGVKIKAGLSAESDMNRPLNCALSTGLLQSVVKGTRLRGVSERLPDM